MRGQPAGDFPPWQRIARAPLALLCLASPALASLPAASPAQAGDMYLSIGAGGGLDDAWSWQSLTYTPFSRADESGLLIRAIFRSETKTYTTDIPARDDARIWVTGIGVDGELGWQIAGDWGQAAVLAGIAWRDYELSPNDPNSSLGPNQINARVTAQGQLKAADRWGSFWYGEYVSGANEWFAEAKPYYELENGLKLGPEFSLSGSDDYLHARAGIFALGWELDLPWVGKLWLGGSAGALWDTDGTRVEPYGAVHVTRAISAFGTGG